MQNITQHGTHTPAPSHAYARTPATRAQGRRAIPVADTETKRARALVEIIQDAHRRGGWRRLILDTASDGGHGIPLEAISKVLREYGIKQGIELRVREHKSSALVHRLEIESVHPNLADDLAFDLGVIAMLHRPLSHRRCFDTQGSCNSKLGARHITTLFETISATTPTTATPEAWR